MQRIALHIVVLATLSLANVSAVTSAAADYYRYGFGYYGAGYHGAYHHGYCCYDDFGHRGLLTHPHTYYVPVAPYYAPTCRRQRIYDGRGGWVWGHGLDCY